MKEGRRLEDEGVNECLQEVEWSVVWMCGVSVSSFSEIYWFNESIGGPLEERTEGESRVT